MPDEPEADFDQPAPEPASALEPTLNVAEPAAIRDATKARAMRERSSAEFWQGMLSTPDGRREAWSILAKAGAFEMRGGISASGGYDPEITAFHRGQNALGQALFFEWLGYDQDGVLQMLLEHQPQAIAAAKTVQNTAPRRRRRNGPP